MEKLRAGIGFIFSSYKRTAAILFIGALTLAIPITLSLMNQQQDIRQRAETPAPTTAPTVAPNNTVSCDPNNFKTFCTSDSTPKMEWCNPMNNTLAYLDCTMAGMVCSPSTGKCALPNWTTSPTPAPTASGGTLSVSWNCYFDASSNINKTSAILSWTAKPGFDPTINKYYVYQTTATALSVLTATVTTTSTQVSNLETSKLYIFRVETPQGIPWAGPISSSSPACSTSATNTPTPTITPTPASKPLVCGSLGDVDGDGRITLNDSTEILRKVAGLPPYVNYIAANADVDGNGTVDAVDALKIQRYLAGLDSTFAGCSANQPSATATPTATKAPTATVAAGNPSPSPTSTTGGPAIAVSVIMPAIGSSAGGNTQPKRPMRNAQLTLLDSQGHTTNASGTLTFDGTKFKGTVNIGANAIVGAYTVKVNLDNTLKKLVPGPLTIVLGQPNTLPDVTLVPGDIDQNNVLDLSDWNAMLSCVQGGSTCSASQKTLADLNDDGRVDEMDLNILLRGFATRNGD